MQVGRFDAGLVTGEIDAQTLEELTGFLVELARVRQVALSVPTAWNAFAFGFDLAARRYTSALVVADELPKVALGETVEVLPSGALARLSTASKPLPCEVLYREGEHELLGDDGLLPSWLSGAPQGASGPLGNTTPSSDADGMNVTLDGRAPHGERDAGSGDDVLVVRERLVVDVAVLDGDGLGRLRRLDERWITEQGHLVVRSRYGSVEQADLSEARLYATYLLRTQCDLVARVLHAAGLGAAEASRWEADELATALHASLGMVQDLLGLSDLVQWRESWVHPQVYANFSHGRDGIGADELRSTAFGLAKQALPRPMRGGLIMPAKPAYLALGPALRAQYPSADGLRGTRYGTTVSCAHLALTELLGEQEGALRVGTARVHLRLDDAFQGGGVWRAEQVDVDTELDPVDLPLALGWREAAAALPGAFPAAATAEAMEVCGGQPDQRASGPASGAEQLETEINQQAAEAKPDPEPERAELPDAPDRDTTVSHSDDTVKAWTFVLTEAAFDTGAIKLPPTVAEVMWYLGLAGAPMQVSLTHPGIDSALRRQPVQLVDRKLVGLRWPPQMFIGMRLTGSWSLDGYFIDVEAIPLPEPLIVDGIPLDFAFDEEVLLRSWGSPTDLDDPDELLSPTGVLQVLRLAGLRVPGRGPLMLHLPWLALLHWLAQGSGTGEQFAEQAAVCVDVLTRRSTMAGSVLVQWANPTWTEDPEAEGGGYFRPVTTGSRIGRNLQDMSVVLSLAAKPSGRPSLVPKATTGLHTAVSGSLRRGHTRLLTRGRPSPEKRAALLKWADDCGVNRDALPPQMTLVDETRVRRYRRKH